MQKIIKILLIIIGIMIINIPITKANTLIKEEHDNIWIFRKGGGLPSFSSKFTSYNIDGLTTYCIEPGEHITTYDYVEEGGIDSSPFDNDTNKKLELIGYYGYDYPNHKTIRYRMATQALIWETISPQKVEFWTEKSGSGTYINVQKEKDEILSLINKHDIKPSFENEIREVTLNSYTTFIDTNNVLSEYKVANFTGIDYTINNNELSIAPLRDGDIIVTLIKRRYSRKETTFYKGKDSNSQKMAYFNLNDDILSKFVIRVIGGNVTIEKKDKDTLSNIPQGNASITGAVYGIYYRDYNERVGEVIINNDGIGISNNLNFGNYYLIEETPPKGYMLDPTKYYFDVTLDNMYPKVTTYDEIIKREFELYKVINNKITGIMEGEKGIQFDFYLKSTMELIDSKITNDDGYISILLPFGKYIVKQATTLPGYDKAPDFEIDINSNESEPIKKVISNNIFKSRLKVIKKDIETNSIIKEDVTFKIKNLDKNEYVCQKINYPNEKTICEYTTHNGYFVTPSELEIGNYQLEEVENQIIKGYVWNNKPLKFSITEDSNYINDNEYGIIIVKEFYNKRVTGTLEIFKEDENGNKLDEIEFNLYANDSIYDSNNEVKYHKGDLIKNFFIKDGYYKLNNLNIGKYYLKEVNTRDDLILSDEVIEFEIKNNNQYDEVINIKLDIKNYYKKGKFILKKVEENTNLPIKDVLISVYTLDDILVDSLYTNDNGIVVFDNLKLGKYKYKEEACSNNYVLDNNYHYFEIKDNNEIVEDILSNEIVKVPNTYSNEFDISPYPIIYLLLGSLIIYEKKYFY